MIQVNRGEVQTAIRPIAYTHVTTPQSDARLAILLPGLGYSTDAPAFHYTAGLLLEQGYHIIEVNYRYRDPAYEQVELETQVVSDVMMVLDTLLSSDSYEEVLVVGKSLGTIAMASLWENKAFDRMNGIWLTPLLNRADVKSALSNSTHRQLVIQGDREWAFDETWMNAFATHPSIRPIDLRGVGHSLDHESGVSASLDVLQELLDAILIFIKEVKLDLVDKKTD